MTTITGESVLKDALRRGRGIFAFAIAFSFLCNLLRLTGPFFILLVYDRVLSSGSIETLVFLFTLVVAFLITMGLMDYSRRRLLARFGAQFQERLEEDIFRTAPKEDFFRSSQVKPVSGLSDVDGIRGFFHSSAIIAVLDVCWAPLFLAVVFIFHWILGWVVVGGLALLVTMYLVKASLSKGRGDTASAASQDIADLKDMMRRSKHVLNSQAMTSSFSERWLEARRTSRDSSIALKDWTAWFMVFSRQIKLLLQYSVLAVGAYLVINAEITVGAMITSMFLSVRVFVPVDQFLQELPDIRRVYRNWSFLKKSFANRKEASEHPELWDLEPSLTLSNLTRKSPLSGQPVLRGINLTAEPGSIIEITGSSGAGKTLLAETIVGALPKSGGSIVCGGAKIDRLSLEQSANMFGYVPETVQFVDGTIADNIAGLSTAPCFDRIIQVAKLAQVHDMILGLPDGFQTRIAAANPTLSKGHCHQLALARALYGQPRVLIIDEPDPVVEAALSTNIEQIRDYTQCIIIVLSRQPALSITPDQKYELDSGRLKINKGVKNVIRMEQRSKQPGSVE